ncbi:MAG TPA: xanthine dehydrogenase family protein molybdopterin-binding subunit [Candidatus Tectomicrobia bacterium]|nr:xanthine dehydrogenase family protein molybdopterin-binding subunit [Candidatus Tectomicrobia bacterium]
MATPYATIGQPVGRAEGPEKVSGAAVYPADINLPGTLVGKCLRSPYPYARITSIDVSAARRVPGVHAVLTGSDIPDLLVGRMLRDMPILARDVVRFVGQKVAAVAADDADSAEEALSLIEVEYEELTPVLDPLEALQPNAPVLHPDFQRYSGRSNRPQEHPNLVDHNTWRKGDVEQGFAEADYVFEHTFRTQHQHQAYIEPHASVVYLDPEGRVQVWLNSKMPFQVRQQIAEGIDRPLEQVRINPTFIGGDFGGKGSYMDTHVAYWLSKATGRPIRMVMTYVEELMAANPRHPAVMTFKTGVKRDGTITARHAKLIYDSGGYAAFKPARGVNYGSHCAGPYKMGHMQVDAYMVYTNHVPCGSMRAPGDPQSVFASEAQIDLIARELGMDPYDFRMKSLVEDGDETPLGHHWINVMGKKTLNAAIEAAGYHQPKPQLPGKKVGRGMAIYERHVGAGTSAAKVAVAPDGTVTLYTALRDTGSGFYTVLRQIVGQELGVPYNQVRLVTWTTDDIPFDTGAGGSRVTHVGGQATYGATTAVRQRLVDLAVRHYGWAPEAVIFKEGQVLVPGQTPVNLSELVSLAGGTVEEQHTYEAERDEHITAFCAQVAEVEVDEDTGEVNLTTFTTAHDVGTILNPISHQGQIEGAVMQGIGYTLMEELKYDEGRVSTLSFGDYKIPTMQDIPELRTVLVQSDSGGPTPYGGKSIGEQPIGAVAPAIVNAVLDAVGVSITDLPITSEKVRQALQARLTGA